ncbi:MAG: ATP-binding protein [Candidatus Pelethousia sp.]|nr:ATP-binding protein [Candidatus Pelethousia sp.]
MKPSPDLFQEYRRIHARALAESEERRRAVFAQLPRLLEIARERKDQTFALGQDLLHTADKAATRRAYALTMKALMQEESAILRENNIPPAFLQPAWRCPACEDTGYVTGREGGRHMCACLTQRVLEERFAQSSLSPEERFETFREDVFPTERQRKATCRARDICLCYAEGFPDNDPKGLLLLGQGGLGKTFLLNAVATRVVERGYSVLNLPAYALVQTVLSCMSSRQPLPDFTLPDLLVLDDLGAEPMLNNITREQLSNLLDARQRKGLATAFSSNFTREQIIEEYGERFAFRLLSPRSTLTLELLGDNLRTRL